MNLLKLDIYAVRNIQKASIIPSPTINLIVGKNASGKSAIIEAIYILGRAKSFRSSTVKSVINYSHDYLTVSAYVSQVGGIPCHIGVRLNSNKDMAIHVNQKAKQKCSDLAYAFPLQIFYAKSYELLEAGSVARREFLDWGIFNSDENYLSVWRNFKRTLFHRNVVLKASKLEQLDVWNQEFVHYGVLVNQYRQQYLERLRLIFFDIAKRFLSFDMIDLKLMPGWSQSIELKQALVDDQHRDLRHGITHSGPHRCDFHLMINNRLAKDSVSRGQLKLLVICLKLAQIQLLFFERGHYGCVLLIDDIASDIDSYNREKLLHYLSKLPCQIFITATELQDLCNLTDLSDHKLFHVEQGVIRSE